MFDFRSSVVTLFLVILPHLALAQSSGGLMQRHPVMDLDCIPDSELAISGVQLWMPAETVRSIFGEPPRREVFSPESGVFLDETFHYDGLQVHILGGEVVGLVASKPGLRTPSGLMTGTPHRAVLGLLGGIPANSREIRTDLIYDIYGCNGGAPFELGQFMLLTIDGSDTLREVAILQELP